MLALLAASLLFLLPGGPLHAQEAGTIEYPENRTDAVETYTAEDPEGTAITWTLEGGDAAVFEISSAGVLSFKSSPDFETPLGGDDNNSNTYEVTVQASDGGPGTTATEEVTIKVTNVEEPGSVVLLTLQPQVGVAITATLTDPDNVAAGSVSWQWYRSSSPITDANDGAGTPMSSYTPAPGDVGSRLWARAMYDDEDKDKTAQESSAHAVRQTPEVNFPPTFPDQDLTAPGVQTAQTRTVAENTLAGTNIGAPVVASDPDVLTYSLSILEMEAESFDINRATGQLMTKSALGFETKVTYMVTVTATDPFGATATSVVTITVTDVNEAPMVTGGASIDHAENTEGLAIGGYTATDEDEADNTATGLTWLLSGADASKFDITATGATRTLSFKANPDYESPEDSGRNNVYDVTVRVTDSKGNRDEQDVTIKVSNMEEGGTVTLSTLQPRVGFPVTATLADPDNVTAGSVSWQWYNDTIDAGGLIEDATSATYTPTTDDVGTTLMARASYTDGSPNADDAKDFAMMAAAHSVLADTRNKAPVFADQDAEMEGRQTAQKRAVEENTAAAENIGEAVTATDEDPVLTYSLGGPDAESFSIDRATARLMTKAELDTETKDTYTVTVTATDPSGLTATITVTIEVTNVDEAPEIMVGGLAISGMSRVDYAEDRRDDVATYRASGPDAASATWTLEGDDAGDFDISRSGVLTFKSPPDHEAAADDDTDNAYEVTVVASDGTNEDRLDVTVTVTDVDEAPPVITGDAAPDYAENGTGPVATYLATDPDSATITWTLEGDDAADFEISAGGELTFKSSPNYEAAADDGTDNAYEVTVVASDGTNEDRLDVTVTVTDVDEAPPVITGDAAPDYAENGTGPVATYLATDPDSATITWTLEGDDAADFEISAGGELTFKSSPNYEAAADDDTDNAYEVTVVASDGTNEDRLDVTVTVTDVDEDEAPPVITGDAAPDYAENGTGPVATYLATDPDSATITWTLEGDDAADFEISAGGELTFKSSPNYEAAADDDTDNAYEVTVVASDGTNEDRLDVTVTVTDVDEDEAPPVITGDAAPDYAENGTGPVATYLATDPDSATITWTLEGDDAADFEISAGGELTFKSSPNYEAAADDDTDNAYEVTVVASDGTNEDRLDVTVTDVGEAPPVITGDAAPDYAENGTGPVATYLATDPDSATITWTLEGDDAADFEISAGGELTFKSSPNYEAAADDDTDNAYEVTVVASDGTNEDRLDVTVTVTDVDEDVTLGDPLVDRYDANDNDEIERSEVFAAINDYLGGGADAPTRADVFRLIDLYLGG